MEIGVRVSFGCNWQRIGLKDQNFSNDLKILWEVECMIGNLMVEYKSMEEFTSMPNDAQGVLRRTENKIQRIEVALSCNYLEMVWSWP